MDSQCLKLSDHYDQLIDNTRACMKRAETEWSFNYWDTNLKILLRKYACINL